jgi:hypothetical protein
VNEEVWWYATRAAGLMTWATACGSVLIGLLLSMKSIKSRTGPWFFDLHRFLSNVSMIFLISHMVTLVLHDSAVFTWRALLIPGESTWETTAASMGVIAFWSLIAVELTSLLRKRISNAIWRVAHSLALVTVAAGTYHAWLGGSDVRNPITWAIAGIGCLLAVGLIAIRLQRKDDVPVGHMRKSDHEELLAEMRTRLEGLPVPEQVSQPELKLDSSIALPRRAPLSADAGAVDPLFAPGPPLAPDDLFSPDPLASIPLGDATAELGGWVSESPEEVGLLPVPPSPDPFQRARDIAESESSSPANPFATPDPGAPDADPWGGQPFSDSPFGGTPFENSPFQGAAPFGDSNPIAEPATEPTSDIHQNPFGESAPPVLPNNLGPSPFGSEPPPAAPTPSTPEPEPLENRLPPLEAGSNPFASPEPTVSAFTAPSEPAPSPAPASQPAMAAAAPVPPPLPTASDEVDEAAYTAWLVEWLAFAEKYGDEAPEDPARI